MRAYQIEEKLDRLEMAVEGLREEVEGIKRDILKRHEKDQQAAAGEAAGETPKKRTRKKAEPAE